MREVRWRKSKSWGCVSSSAHGVSSTRWRHLQFTFHFSLKDLWVSTQVIVIRSHSWRCKYSCDFVGFHVPFIVRIFWIYLFVDDQVTNLLNYGNIICSETCCDYVDTTFVWHYHLKCIICMMEGNLRYCYVKQVKGLMNYMILRSHKFINCSGT